MVAVAVGEAGMPGLAGKSVVKVTGCDNERRVGLSEYGVDTEWAGAAEREDGCPAARALGADGLATRVT
jgi:hypothetical protein